MPNSESPISPPTLLFSSALETTIAFANSIAITITTEIAIRRVVRGVRVRVSTAA